MPAVHEARYIHFFGVSSMEVAERIGEVEAATGITLYPDLAPVVQDADGVWSGHRGRMSVTIFWYNPQKELELRRRVFAAENSDVHAERWTR